MNLKLPAAQGPWRFVELRAKSGETYAGAPGSEVGSAELKSVARKVTFEVDLLPRQGADGPLAVQVRFCTTNDCSAPDDAASPGVVLVIDQPFCTQAPTSVDFTIGEIPPVGSYSTQRILAQPDCGSQ